MTSHLPLAIFKNFPLYKSQSPFCVLLGYFTSASQLCQASQLTSKIQTLLALAQCLGFLNFRICLNSTSTAKQVSVVIGKLLYVAFCNRRFNFSLVLCLFTEWRRGSQVLCSPGYRLSSQAKCIVSSALGNSSL